MSDLTLTPKSAKGKVRSNSKKKSGSEKIESSNQVAEILDKAPEMVATFGKWPALWLVTFAIAKASRSKVIFKLGAFAAVLSAAAYGIWKSFQ